MSQHRELSWTQNKKAAEQKVDGMYKTYQISKQDDTLHVVNFHCNKAMFDSIHRDLLHNREIKKLDHLRQALNFHSLIHLRHLEKQKVKIFQAQRKVSTIKQKRVVQ